MLRRRPVVWPWPCDPKSNGVNRLTKVNQCSKFSNHQEKDHKIVSRQHLGWRSAVLPWPLITSPENQKGTSVFHGQPLYQVWQLSSKGVNICSKTSSLTLTWSTPLVGIHCTKCGNFQANGSNILSGHRLIYRPTDRCKTVLVCPFFQRGAEKNLRCNE